ncbi:universal stress protein [Nocardia rhamnosiphila]|jgi:nucleotide-binding universal stress UspA family protein|uniref:universal stress protein n=1 Tax=Nocardia rhamnosiphila TaxID=426716 RepID=UPI0004C3FC55|nr:universal stress protein [Nocardia rhamnosiphila]
MHAKSAASYIVVGIDGSDTSLAAAKWATRFADKLALPLRLVHSSPAPGPMPEVALDPAELAERHRVYRTELLATAESALRDWAPGVTMTSIADTEAPAAGLLRAAEDAALIVLGATGAGMVERWLLGSTALRVVGSARCPVAVWRGDSAHIGPDDRPIVVGADGSPPSAGATRLAFEWAQLFSVPVTAVRVWSDGTAVGDAVPTAMQLLGPTAMVIDWDLIARSEAETLSTIIAPYRKDFPDVDVEERSRRGSAARELLHALDEAQLAIVGSKGWGRFRGALMGSTSQNLLHRADRPIVVYRDTDT